jgi:hypothetical protein
MQIKRVLIVELAIACLLLGSAAVGVSALPPRKTVTSGGVPLLINYQGHLTNPLTGDPVPDANYQMVFTIYDAATEGSPVWTETQTVAVQDGLFCVMLGEVNPLPATVFAAEARWLGVKVAADEEMTPRQRIGSVAYVLQAQNAATLDDHHASNGSGDIPVSNGTVNANLNADLLDGMHASDIVAAGGTVPPGAIILWAGSSCPAGWSRFAALDGKFPRGAASYGGTGGAATHAHAYSDTTGQSSRSERGAGGPTLPNFYSPPDHTHSLGGNTDDASSLPPYLDILFCRKD